MKKEKPDFNIKDITTVSNSLIAALERKHPYTKGHSQQVSTTSYLLAKRLPRMLSRKEMEYMRFGGLLHDIGKICIEISTLNNPSTVLSINQIIEIEDHPYCGLRIILKCGTPFPRIILDSILYHHESYDGKHDGNLHGYPFGLSGEDIPLPGRIVAIADTFNAMTTARSYNKMISPEEASLKLEALAGKMFDPDLVAIFVSKVVPQIFPLRRGTDTR